jgi:hypothetical protein
MHAANVNACESRQELRNQELGIRNYEFGMPKQRAGPFYFGNRSSTGLVFGCTPTRAAFITIAR